MKKFLLALVALTLIAIDAQACGKRRVNCQQPRQTTWQGCQTTWQSCQTTPVAIATSAPVNLTVPTVTTISNCANGTCQPAPNGFFLRR